MRAHTFPASRRLLSVLFVAILASTAHATIQEPAVLIRAELPNRPPQEGASFAIPVNIYVRENATLQNVAARTDLRSAGVAFDLSPIQAKTAPPRYRVERHLLTGTLEPGLDRIRFQVTVDGEVWEDQIHLRQIGDPEEEFPFSDPAKQAGPMLDPTQFSRPEPVPSGFPTEEPSASKVERTVRVHGRLLMRPEDSNPQRGVDGIAVYFMKVRGILDDVELGSRATDVNGNFDFNVQVDGTPDVYIKVLARNSVANIGTDAGFQTYGSNFSVSHNYGGTDFDLGQRVVSTRMNHPAWLLSTYTRAHRWYADQGFFLPSVNCRWWDDVLGSSVYLPLAGMEGIHLRSSAEWQADTVVHEYGHHFVHTSPVREVWPPFYTNGICDPGHCGWCQENEAVAWSEGLPYFLQQEINAEHATRYGWAHRNDASYEALGSCGPTEILGEFPRKTEMMFAAFLNDLIDTHADGSALAPGITEYSELGLFELLLVASTRPISDSNQFIAEMRSFLSAGLITDEQRREFWAAAAVNGMDVDSTPPTPVTSVSTPGHIFGVPSASNLPVMTFNGATDDNSGVEFYKVAIMSTAGAPDGTAIMVRETTISWRTPLAEGSYYINVTVLDRAGNESTEYSHGPIVVGPPDPLDLAFFQPGLWEDSFLVRHTADVTSATGAIEPVLLPSTDFYISLSSRNESAGAGTVSNFVNRVLVDNDIFVNEHFNPGLMTSNQEFQILNNGPYQLGPGRHHFEVLLDADHVVPEVDESNNRVNRYVVIRPDLLAPGAWQTFPRGPDPITTYPQSFPNVAGHRVAPSNQYAAVMLATASTMTDYALQLHPISTGHDNGFETPITLSDNRDTRIETIIMNTSALGASSFDVGALRMREGTLTDYSMRHVSSDILNPGDPITLNWTDQDDLSLLQFTFNVLEAGPFTVEIDAAFDPTDSFPVLELYWIDKLTGTVVPSTTTPDGITDEDGDLTLELNVPSAGTYCLAVFRDTRLSGVAEAVSIQVNTTTVPEPDFAVFRDNHFWDLPFIPHYQQQFGPVLTVPQLLTGEGISTYFNFGVFNAGQANGQNVQVGIDLDGGGGQQFFSTNFAEIKGLETAEFYGSNPFAIPGGRHTLIMTIDTFDQIAERDETNNVFSMQFGWQGPDLILGSNINMAAPPDPAGGLATAELFTAENLESGEEPSALPINFIGDNSDGFRLPALAPKAPAGSWIAVGTMPGVNSNVDVRLHELTTPVQAFTLSLTESTWDEGESDFVLIDRNAIMQRPFDVSVVGTSGNENYDMIALDSQLLSNPPATHGPFGIDGGQFLHLYEISLSPGTHAITLTPLNGTADMGLSVYPPAHALDQPFWSKNDGRDRIPMSYQAPAGATEQVFFDVAEGEQGVYCIAVWKATAADLPANEDYMLDFSQAFPPFPPCVLMDGEADVAYGPPISVQTTQTEFGDSILGQPDAADGSEMDQAYGFMCDDTLYLHLAGNLESNFNDLEIFIDTVPGGQNRLRGDNHSFGGGPDMNRMGDDGTGNGLTFDPLFEPDWWFGVQGGFGASGIPYKMVLYQAELLTGGGGMGRFLGATVATSGGILGGFGADNPDGVRGTIDNINTVGVTAGTGASSGQNVSTGIELAIPLAAIGNPTDCVRITAFVNGHEHDFVSNQVLGPLPVGTGNLGEPRDVDFGEHDGLQYFIVCQEGVTGLDDGIPSAPLRGVKLHSAAPNPFNPRTEIAFAAPVGQRTRVWAYDARGRVVASLFDGVATGHRQIVVWAPDDLSSGVYFVRVESSGMTDMGRVVLLK